MGIPSLPTSWNAGALGQSPNNQQRSVPSRSGATLPASWVFQPTPFLSLPDPAALAQQAFSLAELFYEQSRFKQAKEAYDKVLQLRPGDYSTYNKRGVCKAAIKDYAGAFADYSTAIRFNPGFYNAWVNRGNVRTYMKDYAGAQEDYNQAIRLRPLDTVAYENRSELYSEMKLRDLSLQDRATVIQLERLKPKKSMNLPGCPYRLALVLGNDDYYGEQNDLHGGPLADTQAMQKNLRDGGFEVISGFNMTGAQMQQKVTEFMEKARQHPGAVTLIYYSGHGGSINGNNYMLPIDYDGSVSPDFQQNGVSVDSLLKQLGSVPSLFNIMIFDACRNPLNVTTSRNWEAEPRPGLSNTWIEYASRPNEPALQDNRQGLYTQCLLYYMKDPNLSLKEVFMLASYALEQNSTAQQENQHARSQTDITKTEPFASSFYLAKPCRSSSTGKTNPFQMVSQMVARPGQ